MSLQNEKQSCAVCRAYLFPEDDVVYCPECGAPHHRECYNSVGHCALEHLHGTEKEYKKIEITKNEEEKEQTSAPLGNESKVCPFCKKEIENDARVCPYCGRPNMSGAFFTFDLSGGVKDVEAVAENVTAGDVKPLVAVNTQRYLPKFLNFFKGKKYSWNWLAFLLPQGWFFSRKMYKAGALVTAIILAFEICAFPINSVLNQNIFKDYTEVALFLTNYFNECIATGNYLPLIFAFISTFGPFLVRIFSGIYGDKIYYNHIISRVKKRGESDLMDEEYYHKYGGVSLFAFMLGVIAMNYLPSLIFMLMQSF